MFWLPNRTNSNSKIHKDMPGLENKGSQHLQDRKIYYTLWSFYDGKFNNIKIFSFYNKTEDKSGETIKCDPQV